MSIQQPLTRVSYARPAAVPRGIKLLAGARPRASENTIGGTLPSLRRNPFPRGREKFLDPVEVIGDSDLARGGATNEVSTRGTISNRSNLGPCEEPGPLPRGVLRDARAPKPGPRAERF